MLRREAVAMMLAGCARVRASQSLSRFFESAQGTGLLVDIRSRRLLAAHGAGVAAGLPAPPGSTIKPFVLAALLRAGKLKAEETFPCPAKLSIGRHNFDCSHPPLASPLRVPTALAYSCNCFAAHFAERFSQGELAGELRRAGLGSLTGLMGAAEVPGRVDAAAGREANQLQALGEERVMVTAAGLAMGYRYLALGAGLPDMRPIVEGLESAVEFGTAQLARVEGLQIAGKTGSVRTNGGVRIAWFAGFAPSRAPEVAVIVMLQGRSGGADAAPIAGRILQAWRMGRV